MVNIKRASFVILGLIFWNTSFTQQTLNWSFIHPVTKAVYQLGEKGSVQERLIENGGVDPFVGSNGDAYDWVENYDWEFHSEFILSQADLNRNVDLDFSNIDTYAKLYLNEVLIGTTENAFVHYRFDVTKWGKVGINQLKIVFQSPVNYQKTHMKSVGVLLPAPNDSGKLKIASYCRKPQYQFGWDWSLRMNTIGFWEPVKVIVYDENRVVGTSTSTLSIQSDSAIETFFVFLRNHSDEPLIWKSELFDDAEVRAKNGQLIRNVTIKQPKLWWPRGQGEQSLYHDRWIITTRSGDTLYDAVQTFGIRTSELIQKKDQWGTSFELKINGRTIFCKGADYIPDDVFPSRITDEKLRRMVAIMAESNFNMVRIWGGGMYPKEAFLKACDEQGIMVWQDFMFACAMYPGNNAFLKNIQVELEQQIPRIAGHPAVVLFNGNNEVDVAWKNWGFQSTYHLTAADCKLIETYYNRVFKELIPTTVKKYTPLPYEHTSPLSNWGKDEYFNHGTQHYWGVWHGNDPIGDFATKIGRFNAEYGFQSFPELSTIRSFSDSSDWLLNSPVMKYHQKSYVGNAMIAKHSDSLFGATTDFKRFVYYSQLTQAEAVRLAVTGHRLNFPRCTGSLYWQFNDCWPAPTWSSIDYYGNWKALQYTMKQTFADVTVLKQIDSTNVPHFWLLSDSPNGFHGTLTCEVYRFNGELLERMNCSPILDSTGKLEVFSSELEKWQQQPYFIRITGNIKNDTTILLTAIHRVSKDEHQRIPIAFMQFKEINAAEHTGKLTVYFSDMVEDFWISSRKLGVHFETNFEDFLPGSYTFPFTFDELPELNDFETYYRY